MFFSSLNNHVKMSNFWLNMLILTRKFPCRNLDCASLLHIMSWILRVGTNKLQFARMTRQIHRGLWRDGHTQGSVEGSSFFVYFSAKLKNIMWPLCNVGARLEQHGKTNISEDFQEKDPVVFALRRDWWKTILLINMLKTTLHFKV